MSVPRTEGKKEGEGGWRTVKERMLERMKEIKGEERLQKEEILVVRREDERKGRKLRERRGGEGKETGED